MIYDLDNEIDITKFDAWCAYVKEKKRRVEGKIKNKRSRRQNSYLHLILSHFALEYGETAEYVKQNMYKKIVNKDIYLTEYTNRKTGEVREEWKSSKDLTTSEMKVSIDRFRDYSSKEAGIYLPQANEHHFLDQIEKDLKRYEQYL